MTSVMTLKAAAEVAAATHPVRAAILEAMRTPTTAAAVARAVGQSRQNVAYHVRELEKAGLVRHVGQRQNGNFLEQTYVAVARSFVVSPTCTWGDPGRRAKALADQLSLGQLVAAGERLLADSASLLDQAVFDSDEIPSASVVTEMHFESEEHRADFLRGYVAAVSELARKYSSRTGTPYRLIMAAYPTPDAS